MQTSVNERLKILIEALGTNPGAMSRILGISPSTLRNYTDRDSKPGYEVLEKLYHSFKHINLHWLFGEPGEPLLSGAAEAPGVYQRAKNNSGNMMGTNHGTITQTQHHASSANCEEQLAAAKEVIALLRSQLVDKERIIQFLERSK